MDFTWITDPTALAALATLVVMEVVLGIDNLIFISILTNKLPEHRRAKARRIGIGLALFLRLALLGTIAIIVQLTQPVFAVLGHPFSWRDMILIGGVSKETGVMPTCVYDRVKDAWVELNAKNLGAMGVGQGTCVYDPEHNVILEPIRGVAYRYKEVPLGTRAKSDRE